MTLTTLSLRSLLHHWRTNLAVCLGVAAAVAVLGGALLVGDSVKGSLRDLALSRLGSTAYAISATGYVRDELAATVVAHGAPSAVPLIATTGFITHEPSGRRASGVLVYGVDERFWRFHGVEPRDGVLVSPALASELGIAEGDVLLTRLQRPSEIPLESLFAHKEDVARTSRLTVAGTLPRARLGEFSLQPQQAEVRAVFAPLARLRRDLDVAGQVNTILIGGNATDDRVERAFRSAVTLADLGVTVGVIGEPAMVGIDSAGGVLAEPLERSVREVAEAERVAAAIPVFTYLANSIRVRDRVIPYSLVTGIDLKALPAAGRTAGQSQGTGTGPAAQPDADAIVLNEWTPVQGIPRSSNTICGIPPRDFGRRRQRCACRPSCR
jgi:putative ABC transport system permease protein